MFSKNKITKKKYNITKSDQEWRDKLDPLSYQVTRKKHTERPFTGEHLANKQEGIYSCKCCDNPLFDSKTKFDSATGWPSFYQALSDKAVDKEDDFSLFVKRTEVLCSECGAHLGHVFDDGPKPTGLRYCINSVALDFKNKI